MSALVRAIAAWGLRGSKLALPERALSDDTWAWTLRRVQEQGLEGLLVDALIAGALPCNDQQFEQAVELHAASMGVAVRLERLLLDTVGALDEAGIDYRVLKGSSIAHSAYPSASLRVFGDVDLLVRSEQFDAAVRLLEERGCQRPWPQLRAGFDRRFGKAATLRTATGSEIDLHRTLVPGPYGLTIQLGQLWAEPARFELAGRCMATLDRERRFLLACYGAALADAPPRLMPLRDVAQLLLFDPPDATSVLQLASDWRGEAVLARGIGLAWQRLELADAVPLSAWAASFYPSRRDARRVGVYTRRGRTQTRRALASLPVIPGLGAKAAFVRGLAMPDRETVTRYESGYLAWWKRGTRKAFARDQRSDDASDGDRSP